jgi:hypothetical protein
MRHGVYFVSDLLEKGIISNIIFRDGLEDVRFFLVPPLSLTFAFVLLSSLRLAFFTSYCQIVSALPCTRFDPFRTSSDQMNH